MCQVDLRNRYSAQITFPLVIYMCTDCAYDRKGYLNYLRQHTPIKLADLKGIGVEIGRLVYVD